MNAREKCFDFMHVVKQLHVLYDVMTWLPCAFHLNSLCCPWPVDDQEIHAVFRLMEFVRKKTFVICVSNREAKPSWIPGWIHERKQTSIIAEVVPGNTKSKNRNHSPQYDIEMYLTM